MKVALYVRRSTIDLQPDSLAAQEELLRSRAMADGHEVVRLYGDSASGKSTDKRDAFRRLIDDVKRGPDFAAVLVRDVSRWSRAENTDEAGFYEFICRTNGVQVLYVDESFGPEQSPYALLMKSVKRAMAAEFSIEKARTVRASHGRLVRQGFWPTGSVPYALKRVLVDAGGIELRTLAHGDRKALSNQRVKLAPGDPVQVGVVRRIFAAYANGASVAKVVADLVTDGIPSSKNSRWTPGMVSYVLQNEAYAGTLVYWFRNGDTPSALLNLRDSASDRVVRCENAHPALIERGLWASVQARIRTASPRRTDEMLLTDLRAARARWRPGKRPPKEIVTAPDLRCGYGKSDNEIITAKKVAEASGRLVTSVGAAFHVTPFEDGYLLDHLLHVGIRVSLPHARFGGLHWSFPFTGEEQEDVILGLAFAPPPIVEHVETFVFRVSQFKKRPHVVRLVLEPTMETQHHARFPAGTAPVAPLRHAIRFRGKRAEELLLGTIQGRDRVSLETVATELSWPVASTRALYRKLEIRGEAVPPLTNGRVGKRLTVTCPHCLRPRSLAPAVVLSLKTDVCFECLHRPPLITPNKLVAECPESLVPAGSRSEGGWALLKILGPFPFERVGVLASVASPLAAAGVSIFAISTFDTDYVLVKATSLALACEVLVAAGHELVGWAPLVWDGPSSSQARPPGDGGSTGQEESHCGERSDDRTGRRQAGEPPRGLGHGRATGGLSGPSFPS
jgi:DNA invertase Pin-like site-specific DNA recombinase